MTPVTLATDVVWTTEDVRVGALTLRLRKGGSGDPMLVLSHDIGSLERLPFYDALARRFTVYVPSHPGYDGSERPNWMRSVRDVAVTYQLLLASIGLYGVLSYAVTQRSREIGLRIALGATAGSVLRVVVARGLVLTGIGLAIGLALAWAGTRVMQNVLYGVTAGDPWTFAAVVGLLGSIALLASYLPARRAARMDPIAVLRAD